MSSVIEVPVATTTKQHQLQDGSTNDERRIRCFRMSLNGVSVEVSNIGASIQRLLLPRPEGNSGSLEAHEDCVLGYDSPVDMMRSNNPMYMGVVVGRVANRIAGGCFELKEKTAASAPTKHVLATNNGPNHLHGGNIGFGRRVWDADIVPDDNGRAVRFTLNSDDGDDGYPGKVQVTATYALRPKSTAVDGSGPTGHAELHLELRATLLSEDKCTPINLAQHSYFNLAGHANPSGILDHVLTMPNSPSYTPLDSNSIPTREVRSVTMDTFMDFRTARTMRDALLQFAVEGGPQLQESAARGHLSLPLSSAGRTASGTPYGFDHNYVVTKQTDADDTKVLKNGAHLRLVADLSHPPTGRKMTVWSDAPGVQLYTSNYLDGNAPSSDVPFKDGAEYHQWQGLCLETQHYPDSISLDESMAQQYGEFSKGRCVILRPGDCDVYVHNVLYEF